MKKLMLAAILILGAAGIYAGLRYRAQVYLPRKSLQQDYEKLTQEVAKIRPESFQTDSAQETEASPLEKARQLNGDVVGWIYIPDTNIDFPVVQGEDNDFYLHHGVDKAENQLGVPFLDCRCQGDFSGFSSIVYGHHFSEMRMFAQIFSFKDRAFFDAHRTGYLALDDGVREVEFFAYLNLRSDSPVYDTKIITGSDKENYYQTLLSEAVFAEDLDKESLSDKHLLLLSTCTYEFEDARGVLAGVIRDKQ
ncbi:MAG: sortase [Ruminococcus sp.]|nr:sortase [Ruminococcus sp.]